MTAGQSMGGPLCMVSGATGYLGGRLVPALLEAGYRVRCLARNPDKLREVPWVGQVQIVRGDVRSPEQMHAACADVDVLYFLVHSLSRDGYAALDRRAALITAQAARECGVTRIVYLGGLHPDPRRHTLSPHLASRAEVGEILLRSGVPTAALQAAVIVGSGSASFEMLRHLTERLPIMVAPRWVRNHVQPIAVRDVLHYLVAAAALPATVNRSFDLGGPHALSYAEMMRRYARETGLPRRWLFPVPLLTPKLSSYWIHLVTPVPRSIGGPLIESLINDAVVSEHDIHELGPPRDGGLTSFETSIRLALAKTDAGAVQTRWSDASSPRAPADAMPTDPAWVGGNVFAHTVAIPTRASAAALWAVIEGLGGLRGWYCFPPEWAARGWLARLLGHPAHRRGRRDPTQLRVGEALDWWRVEQREQEALLRLRGEMRTPGQAWLELRIDTGDIGQLTYTQRAIFQPHGLVGQLYWRAIAPLRAIVFNGMARSIIRAAEHPHTDHRNSL